MTATEKDIMKFFRALRAARASGVLAQALAEIDGLPEGTLPAIERSLDERWPVQPPAPF